MTQLMDDRERSALVMLENLLGVFRSVPHFPEANQICMNTLEGCVAPERADKNFIDSSPNPVQFTLKKTGQIDSYSINLTTINFSDDSMYLLLTFEGN